jgi:hypothetical protein
MDVWLKGNVRLHTMVLTYRWCVTASIFVDGSSESSVHTILSFVNEGPLTLIEEYPRFAKRNLKLLSF